MGPKRTIHDRRGYLTETVFDAERGAYVERPFPFTPATPRQASPGEALTGVLAAVERRMRAAHADHLGYPYNLTGRASTPAALGDFLINNLGDPYAGSHYGSEVCDLEREAVDWLMHLWECDMPEEHWGSVVASGTEGNIWALYLAREALPEAVLIHSAEAHYSIPKAARILRMRAISVACDADGAINLDALSSALSRLDRKAGVILALTCGTTVKGAHDDIEGAMERLDAASFDASRRFVHVDGALNAMVLPFLAGVPSGLRPSFRHRIDSLSTSGHKMIGTPMPCGVLITRRAHVARVAQAIAYLRSDDTTLMGSRNGHAVLAVWTRLMGHGIEGFRHDAETCRQRAETLAEDLRAQGLPVLLNPFSLTVLFPEPDPATVTRFQLSCSGRQAHAVVMPNVGEGQLRRFREAYLAWWETEADARAITGEVTNVQESVTFAAGLSRATRS
jgi:histidine decarboxylase